MPTQKKKSVSAKKKPSGKSAGAKAAPKSATSKKATAKKAAPRKATPKKTKQAVSKPETSVTPAVPEKPRSRPRAGVSSLQVNMGHVMMLRPRVPKSFRPADFQAARQFLQDEDYPTIEQAARAVAEKALELTQEGPPKRGFRR